MDVEGLWEPSEKSEKQLIRRIKKHLFAIISTLIILFTGIGYIIGNSLFIKVENKTITLKNRNQDANPAKTVQLHSSFWRSYIVLDIFFNSQIKGFDPQIKYFHSQIKGFDPQIKYFHWQIKLTDQQI